MVLSFFVSPKVDADFILTSVAIILRDLALVFLVLFFLWHNNEPFSSLGLRVSDPAKEITLGIVLFIPVFLGANILGNFLVKHGLHTSKTVSLPFVISNGIDDLIIATLLVIVVAFSEEIIFRGYLMLRIKGATASTVWAAIFSTVVFSLGHGYEGSAGVVTVGAIGLTFALIYLWRGNLITAMTMHFLQDFMSIVLIPFLNVNS